MANGTAPYTKKDRLRLLVSELRTDRASWESHWKELADFVRPRRIRLTTDDVNRGDKRNQKINDSTATFALRILASGLMSGVTSPARPWFRLTVADPTLSARDAVKRYLDDVRDVLLAVFSKSNLYQELNTFYSDLGNFGTAAMSALEDDETVLRFQSYPIGSYWLGADAKRRPRVFAREYKLTVRQIVERWGRPFVDGVPTWTNISPAVRTAWENGQREGRYDVTLVVEPNQDYRPGSLLARHLPFSSCYYEPSVTSEVYLEESGFETFPIMAGRWEAAGEDVYGSDCPAMVALGDIKQLQLQKKREAEALDKIVRPPMVGSTAMMNRKLSQLPGEVSYVDENQHQKFRPAFEINLQFDKLLLSRQEVQQMIRTAFFQDLFLMLSSLDASPGRFTATEIVERKEEKMLALGPVLSQTDQDLLNPLVDRAYRVCYRRGLLPPAPAELEGQDLKVEYISVLAQAQKSIAKQGIREVAEFVIELAEGVKAGDPAVFDKIDVDQAIEEYAEATGIPQRLIVDDDQVAKIRGARAQAAERQQQAEQAAQLATAAQKLGATNTSGQNALTDLASSVGPAALAAGAGDGGGLVPAGAT